MRLLFLTAIILGFHTFSQANQITGSIVIKKNNQLVMISESQVEWGLNQVPFNSIKNLQIKGTFVSAAHAILVFDLNETLISSENASVTSQTYVLTAQQKLIAADVDAFANGVKVQISDAGEVRTITTNSENATFVGSIGKTSADHIGEHFYWLADGQILSKTGKKMGHVIIEGAIVTMVTDLNKKIATLTGSGSEVVISGEKKEFLASIDQLQYFNEEQKQNSEWAPVADLKISNLSSVLQVEFRNSTKNGTETESFSVFKLMAPMVVSQIKQNQADN